MASGNCVNSHCWYPVRMCHGRCTNCKSLPVSKVQYFKPAHTHQICALCGWVLVQLLFPVLGIGQEASPRGLRGSDSMVTINLFDEVVTPTAASKAMRAVARASSAGVSMQSPTLLVWCRRALVRLDINQKSSIMCKSAEQGLSKSRRHVA